ncbi:hypothetical protein G9A89_006757 [Geosiphon pyriformis]|nr:hypothetical protein G9A89_006757 [Geosiphon pyriformis]
MCLSLHLFLVSFNVQREYATISLLRNDSLSIPKSNLYLPHQTDIPSLQFEHGITYSIILSEFTRWMNSFEHGENLSPQKNFSRRSYDTKSAIYSSISLGSRNPPNPPLVPVTEIKIYGLLARMAKYANSPHCGSILNHKTWRGKEIVSPMGDVRIDFPTGDIVAYFGAKRMDVGYVLTSPPVLISYRNIPDARVHKEWFEETNVLLQKISPLIIGAIINRKASVIRLRFTGHGVAGAYALLAGLLWAEFLRSEKIKPKLGGKTLKLAVVTFGQPRVGNHYFANYVNQIMGNNLYRVTYRNDFIPQLPPRKEFDAGFIHHEVEYWISDPDCDCLNSGRYPGSSANYDIFECRGIWEHDRGKAVRENQDCNSGVSQADFSVHNGPYFETVIHDCRSYSPVVFM